LGCVAAVSACISGDKKNVLFVWGRQKEYRSLTMDFADDASQISEFMASVLIAYRLGCSNVDEKSASAKLWNALDSRGNVLFR
jgi:hypothetical protein